MGDANSSHANTVDPEPEAADEDEDDNRRKEEWDNQAGLEDVAMED